MKLKLPPSLSNGISSYDNAVVVPLALLGGVVLGGIAGSALTARYLRSSCNEEDGEGNGDNITSYSRGTIDVSSPNNNNSPRSNTNFDDLKHINFLSDVIARLWPYINRAGQAMIIESLTPTFQDLPGPLKSLKFVQCDLGTSPIVIDNIVVHEETGGAIQFDWDVIWDTTCKIQLKADYGISFGVKAIELRGRMSFLMKPLSDVIPCVDAITYSFINPPTLEIDFTGLANVAGMCLVGRTNRRWFVLGSLDPLLLLLLLPLMLLLCGIYNHNGIVSQLASFCPVFFFPLVDWSIVEKSIRQTINDSLASMVVLPVRMMTKLSPQTHLFDIHTPLKGVARVTVISGRGFVEEKRKLRSNDVPDIYLKVQLGASSPWKTPTIHNDLNPNWTKIHQQNLDGQEKDWKNQNVKDFVLADLDQILTIQAWDEDSGTIDTDDLLGFTKVTVGQLLLSGNAMELELLKEERKGSLKPTGSFVTVGLDLLPFTTVLPSSLEWKAILEAPIHPSNQLVGLATLLISQAFNLPVPKEEAESFVKVLHGENVIGFTGTVTALPGYDAVNPLYEVPFHIPLTPLTYNKSEIKLQLINKETMIGELVIEPKELLESKTGSMREKKNIGKEGASLQFALSLCGVASKFVSPTDISAPSMSSISPSSVVGAEISKQIEITIVKGSGFKAKKKGRLIKKLDVPDVYCIMKFGSSPQSWRTKTIKDSTTPAWGESRKYTMTSPSNAITIDVYDQNRKTKDHYYGSARISVGKVMLAGGTTDVEITATDGNSRTGLLITVSARYKN